MLWHCDKLTDVGLHAIGERLKNVRHAFSVTDDGYAFKVERYAELSWMLHRIDQLEVLDVGSPLVSDIGLRYLSQLTNLRSLEVIFFVLAFLLQINRLSSVLDVVIVLVIWL